MVNKWIKASLFRWHFDIHLWMTKFTAESPFASCNVNRFVRCHLIQANIWSTHNFTPLPAAIFARNAQNCVTLITICINIAGKVQTAEDSVFFFDDVTRTFYSLAQSEVGSQPKHTRTIFWQHSTPKTYIEMTIGINFRLLPFNAVEQKRESHAERKYCARSSRRPWYTAFRSRIYHIKLN